MDLDKLVSVIIPTMNRTKKTVRAIDSVLQQTYKNIEIVVIDDTSDDCSEYFKNEKITYIWNNNPQGSPIARNIGIKESKGDYIAFLDDDDEWLPTKLEKQLLLFGENNTVLVGCWIDDRRFYKPYILRSETKVYLKEMLKKFNFLSTSAYLFDAKWLKRHPFDTTFPSAQEYELAIRACMAFPVKCYPEVLVIQHRTEGQITKNWRGKQLGLELLLKKHKILYSQYSFIEYITFRMKFLGLQIIYSLAKIFGERVYRIIVPLKMR